MLISIVRTMIGFLFVFTGALKLTDLISFHDAIEAFDIIPVSYSNIATVLIPPVEIVCGLALISNLFRKGAALSLFVLLGIFTIAIAINLYRGEIFDCNCFGPLHIFGRLSIYKMSFNVFLLAILVIVYFKSAKRKSIFDELMVLGAGSLIFALTVNIFYGNMNLKNYLKSFYVKKADFETALDMMKTKDAVLFDARLMERYNEGHVPGALPFPMSEFQEFYPKYASFGKSRPVFIYCDGSDCTASQRLAFKLIQKGMEEIYTIPGGWSEWKLRK